MPPPYTPLGRVKRMARKLDVTQNIYQDVITVGASELQNEEGRAILDHSSAKVVNVWRTKVQVQRVREGLKKDGWFKNRIYRFLQKDDASLDLIEGKVKDFFLDAMNTSHKAAEVSSEYAKWKDGTSTLVGDDTTLFSTIDYTLKTVLEEGEDLDPDPDLPEDLSFTASGSSSS